MDAPAASTRMGAGSGIPAELDVVRAQAFELPTVCSPARFDESLCMANRFFTPELPRLIQIRLWLPHRDARERPGNTLGKAGPRRPRIRPLG